VGNMYCAGTLTKAVLPAHTSTEFWSTHGLQGFANGFVGLAKINPTFLVVELQQSRSFHDIETSCQLKQVVIQLLA